MNARKWTEIPLILRIERTSNGDLTQGAIDAELGFLRQGLRPGPAQRELVVAGKQTHHTNKERYVVSHEFGSWQVKDLETFSVPVRVSEWVPYAERIALDAADRMNAQDGR